MMRSFHEAIDLPFEDVSDCARPEWITEVDIGDGAGGMTTILNLIYHALILKEEAEEAKANPDKEKKLKKSKFVKKDLHDIE